MSIQPIIKEDRSSSSFGAPAPETQEGSVQPQTEDRSPQAAAAELDSIKIKQFFMEPETSASAPMAEAAPATSLQAHETMESKVRTYIRGLDFNQRISLLISLRRYKVYIKKLKIYFEFNELKICGVCSVEELKEAFPATELRNEGYPISDLIGIYTYDEMLKAGYSDSALIEWITGGLSFENVREICSRKRLVNSPTRGNF